LKPTWGFAPDNTALPGEWYGIPDSYVVRETGKKIEYQYKEKKWLYDYRQPGTLQFRE
jgi:hypothetical protein